VLPRRVGTAPWAERVGIARRCSIASHGYSCIALQPNRGRWDLECLPDPEGFAREVARVLRPGSQLVVAHYELFLGEQVALAAAGRYFYSITGFAYTGRRAAA